MSTTAGGRPGRFGRVAAAALLALAGSLLLVAPQASAATGPGALTCKSGTAPIFSLHTTGELGLYQHADPAGGSFTWGPSGSIGWGWGGRAMAGPAGYVYNITDPDPITGVNQLRLLHYNGSGWDTMDGSSIYRTVGQGWNYNTADARNHITVDEDGVIFTLEGDQLRAWVYDYGTSAWQLQGGVIDTGFSKYNLIAAAGPGVIYARGTDGTLDRYYIDFWTNSSQSTWVRPTAPIGSGWGVFGSVTSAGGDVLYSVVPSTGALMWSSYDPTAKAWATPYSKQVGAGWGNERDVTAMTNSCTRFAPTATTSATPKVAGSVGRHYDVRQLVQH